MTGTNYQKVLNIITPELDELYTAITDVKKAIHVYTARGMSLDNIGVLLDFERSINETDESYRNGLINTININTIAGTKTAIRQLLSNYLRIEESEVIVRETVPNYIIVQLPPEFEIYDLDIKDIIYRSVSAGVYVGIYYSGTYWDDAKWDSADSEWS
ncbi:MAG: hypothetical protein WCQ65_09545 [Fermentimonas sp.]